MTIINPDGVVIMINPKSFMVNSSLFIPCVNIKKGKRQIKDWAKKEGFSVAVETRIENEALGLRVWRTA